ETILRYKMDDKEIQLHFVDEIKSLAFGFSSLSKTTLSPNRLAELDFDKKKLLQKFEKKDFEARELFKGGLATYDEFQDIIFKIWSDFKNNISLKVKETL